MEISKANHWIWMKSISPLGTFEQSHSYALTVCKYLNLYDVSSGACNKCVPKTRSRCYYYETSYLVTVAWESSHYTSIKWNPFFCLSAKNYARISYKLSLLYALPYAESSSPENLFCFSRFAHSLRKTPHCE